MIIKTVVLKTGVDSTFETVCKKNKIKNYLDTVLNPTPLSQTSKLN